MHHGTAAAIMPIQGSGGSGHDLRHLIAPWAGGSTALWVGETTLQPGVATKESAIAVESAHVTVEGTGVEIVDGERTLTGPGSFVYMPIGTPHQVINTGNGPLRLITISTPSPPGAGPVAPSEEGAQ